MKPLVIAVSESFRVDVPGWVVDLGSFRRWADTDGFPEKGNIWFLNGDVWIDLSKEDIFTHVLVKSSIAVTLTGIVKEGHLGLFLASGLFLSNVEADFAGKPDGTFVSEAAFKEGRVRFIDNRGEGVDELEGSPDMVLEVVSRSSVRKDYVDLRRAYWEAGVREYWLVDARRDPPTFTILRPTVRGFTTTRTRDGWLKSEVFGKAFRLVRGVDVFGAPDFTLEVR